MKDEDLKAAINEIASRNKGPIELAFEKYELTLEEMVRESSRYSRHRSKENMDVASVALGAHIEAKLALSKALWDAQKALTEQTTSAWPVPLDLKSLAMSLYPRSKL